MPPELAALTRDGWLAAMDLLVPGIARARRVLLPSTSQRVVVDGAPLHSDSFHLFAQVADAGEIPRVWPQLLPKSFLVELEPGRPLGFLRPKYSRTDPAVVVAHQPWSIFDPSTGSPERLVFDGKPKAVGAGIEIAPPEVEVFDADPIDLSAFQDLGDAAIPVVERLSQTRIKVERAGNGAGVRIVGVQFTSPTLSMDLEVETERGWTTVGELHARGAGHTRLQSPFRDSTSWAAYYGTHKNGSPFIFDTGTNTKYVLPDAPGQPDDDPPWPDPLGDAAFHGLAGDVVRAIEPHTEADPAAILLSFLAAFGNACGRGPHVQVEGDRHCAQLYVAVVGETAKARKGTSWGRVRELMARAAPAWRTASGMSSGEGLIWQVRDRITKMVKGEEVTVDEGVSDKRLLIVEPEFATALRQCERAGNTLSSILRAFWDTGDVQSLTKNSPARTTGALISIVAHITADELRRYLTRTELGNGYGNRFLFCCARRSKVLPFGGGEFDVGPLAAQVEGLINRAHWGALQGPQRVLWTDAAKVLWCEAYPGLSEGKPGLLGAVTSRAEAQCIRLALLYALLDHSAYLERHHVEAALAVWRYCEDSARFVFGNALGDDLADTILRALKDTPAGLTRSEISALFSRNVEASAIARALQALKARGLAQCRAEATAGRATERWTFFV
jgi:hypothetical protein